MTSRSHHPETPAAAGGIVHVRSLPEAFVLAQNYDAVLTVGPTAGEVSRFNHTNHRVVTFDDVSNHWFPDAPTVEQVASAVEWGAAQEGSLLVHCHMGISRSTATAWGVLILRGEDPEEALRRLWQDHPVDSTGERREFAPNRLVVEHLETVTGVPGLLVLRNQLLRN